MQHIAEVLITRPSGLILATLLVILGASLWVFTALVRRETMHRRSVALALWAGSRNLRVTGPETDWPELAPFKQFKPKIHSVIRGENLTLARIDTAETALSAGVVAARRWHLILHRLPENWPTTALRPTAHNISAADLFSLSSYPSLMPTERFMIFGSESKSAHALANSSAPALLPADVGLIIYGHHLILDFSDRPFDEIEFDRLIDLTEQIAPRLVLTKPE